MKAYMRAYQTPQDFLRIRDFLKTAYYSFGKPVNWGLERWNWGRFHPSVFGGDTAAHIKHFEESVRLWEDTHGRILAVLNTEQPVPSGEAWIQRVPEANALLDEILKEAETHLAHPADGILRLEVYDHDDALVEAVQRRGYERSGDFGHWSMMPLDAEAKPVLERGFSIRSMADPGSSVDPRCKAMGLGFNHVDPGEWCTQEEYLQVQSAPDYRLDLDLMAEAPNGEYASICIAWYDDLNRFGVLEPVCTVPEYRRRGMGRAVIREAFNRLYRLGARTVYVGSGQGFYAAIGFEKRYISRSWLKRTKNQLMI